MRSFEVVSDHNMSLKKIVIFDQRQSLRPCFSLSATLYFRPRYPLGHVAPSLPAHRGAALSRREEPGDFFGFQGQKMRFGIFGFEDVFGLLDLRINQFKLKWRQRAALSPGRACPFGSPGFST